MRLDHPRHHPQKQPMKRYLKTSLPFTIGFMFIYWLFMRGGAAPTPEQMGEDMARQQLHTLFGILEKNLDMGFVGLEGDDPTALADAIVRSMNNSGSSAALDALLQVPQVKTFTWVRDGPDEPWEILVYGVDEERLVVVEAYGPRLDEPLEVREYDVD